MPTSCLPTTRRRAAVATAAAVTLPLVVAAVAAPDAEARSDRPAGAARTGGTLTVLWSADVDYIDPGRSYYAPALTIINATQRTLYTYHPRDVSRPLPDLAVGPPEVAADGRSVTVRLRPSVRFSPPVNREVTSRDVKYAIERGFFRTVANGYSSVYFGALVGAVQNAAPGRAIAGLETPDDRTLVLRLTRPVGGSVAAALVMASTAPVPAEYAAAFDRRNPSTYGTHQVATGPYMIRNDPAGLLTGYVPGRRIHLVRNPNWDRATDFRPAALDVVDIRVVKNPDAAMRRVVNGRRLISGELAAPTATLREIVRRRPAQITFTSPGGVGYQTMNTTLAPFDRLSVRRAVVAGMDRAGLLAVSGGRLGGDVATHVIPPGTIGFREAGGRTGPGFDFYAAPRGDLAVARRYLRKAGYRGGRFTGPQVLRLAAPDDPISRAATRIVVRGLERLGFRTRVGFHRPDTYFTTVCPRPRTRVHMCLNAGWVRDFPDPQTILDPLFNGASIQAENNQNWSQLDVPAINRAMIRARTLTDPAARARAWGRIDRQVTAQAAVALTSWFKAPLVRSRDVEAVPNRNTGFWDLTYTSLR